MNAKLVIGVVSVIITGCASVGSKKPTIPTLESQTFNTNIPGETIKIDKSCGWVKRKQCEIESITAVGVQSSAGGTLLQQKVITTMACDNARANVVGYVFGEQVSDYRNSRTRGKQNENQQDTFKSKVGVDDSDPNDTANVIKSALIDTDIDAVRTITVRSQGRLVGFKIVDTDVLDKKTIACKLQWSRRDNEDLNKVRGLIAGN